MKLRKLLEHIEISDKKIEELVKNSEEIALLMPNWNIPQLPDFGNDIINFKFLTFINSMNFCFIESDKRERWRNRETGEYGAFGVFTALSKYFKKLIDENGQFDSDRLREVDLKTMKEIFAGDPDYGEMPLLEERVEIFHELAAGMKLFPFDKKRFNKREFIDEIVSAFPSYNDYLQYKGVKIEVMKRAQLLMGMVVARKIIEIEDPENIDLFADYRVPQVLREMGILIYSDEIIEKLRNKIFIKEGDPLESEIRIATLVAGRLIREKFKSVGKIINCIELDYFLWMKSRTLNPTLEFHRTYSTKY